MNVYAVEEGTPADAAFDALDAKDAAFGAYLATVLAELGLPSSTLVYLHDTAGCILSFDVSAAKAQELGWRKAQDGFCPPRMGHYQIEGRATIADTNEAFFAQRYIGEGEAWGFSARTHRDGKRCVRVAPTVEQAIAAGDVTPLDGLTRQANDNDTASERD